MSVSYQERRARRLSQDTLVEHPFSSLDGSHLENPFYVDLMNTAPIQRLKKISQLSFLYDKSPGDRYKSPFFHNRFTHTVAVAALMEQVLKDNGFSEADMAIGVAAAFLHDAAMPAYGDTIKLLDPQALDEETHWQDVVNAKVRSLLKAHDVPLERIDEIVKNKGVMGKLLDITDRIAYVSKDFHATSLESFGQRFNTLPRPSLKSMNEATGEEKEWLLFYYQFVERMGELYKHVKVDKQSGQVFFTDSTKLGVFLYFRALLHKHMYLHPHNVGKDAVVVSILSSFYTRETDVFPSTDPSLLTPQKLRKMTDFDLRDLILDHGSQSQKRMYAMSAIDSWTPECERFDNIEEATLREQELLRDESLRVVGKRAIRGFKTGVDYLVKTPDGIIPYRDVHKNISRIIQEEEEATHGTYLFYVKKNSLE